MIEPGEILILVSLLLTGTSAILLALSLKGREKLISFAEMSIYGYTFALTLSFFLLLRYFLVRDFNVEYVFEYSDTNLSPIYTISALWAGREGSLLLWAWFLALFNSVYIVKSKKDSVTLLSLLISSSIVLFFCAILLTDYSNPFTRMDFTPADGYGLTPLLRTVEMAIHPPTIFLGYAGMTIPFAIAIAGLLYRESWIKRARSYLIFSWIFLSFGIFIGGWWSYKTLGWGGYWAWDPVENASLLPWLTASALIHGMIVEERKKSFKNLNFFLAVISFDLIVLATFITRSGIISSVHAFGENPIGYAYIGLIIVSTILGVIVWVKRRDFTGGIKFNNFSREALIMLNILILLLSTLTVLIGTLAPLFITEVALSRAFYDRLEIPLGTALVILLGLCSALNWRNDSKLFFKRSKRSVIAGLITGLVVFGLFKTNIASLGAGIFVFSMFNHLQDVRKKDLTNRRKLGGYIVHIGIIFLFIGVMGSWLYDTSYRDVALKIGDKTKIGELELELSDMNLFEDPQKYTITSTVVIYENGEYQGTLEPKQYIYKLDRHDRIVSNVEILSQPERDIYIAMGGMIGHFDGANFEIYLIPMISFVWIGSVLMIIGGTYALIPRIRRK